MWGQVISVWPQTLPSRISHHRQEAKGESHQQARTNPSKSPKLQEIYTEMNKCTFTVREMVKY